MPIINMSGTGNNIKHFMKKAGISIQDMQDACGFNSPNSIYKWFRGDTLPSIDNLVIISDICSVKIDDIIAVM